MYSASSLLFVAMFVSWAGALVEGTVCPLYNNGQTLFTTYLSILSTNLFMSTIDLKKKTSTHRDLVFVRRMRYSVSSNRLQRL